MAGHCSAHKDHDDQCVRCLHWKVMQLESRVAEVEKERDRAVETVDLQAALNSKLEDKVAVAEKSAAKERDRLLRLTRLAIENKEAVYKKLSEVELREEALRNVVIFAKPWLEYTMRRQATGLHPPDMHPLEKLLREVGEALSPKE